VCYAPVPCSVCQSEPYDGPYPPPPGSSNYPNSAAPGSAKRGGIGARLEYLQIPLVFGFGPALVSMVVTNIGAGHMARARRVPWVSAGLATAVTGSIGLFGACFPRLWLGLFSANSEVLTTGATYLSIVGPTYGFFGLGLALYFASQGAGRLLWPLLAGGARLVIAAGGGWVASHGFGGGLPALFAAIAVAFMAYGITVVAGMRTGAWRAAGC
jgi:Na+-driven multidrug efflux pump